MDKMAHYKFHNDSQSSVLTYEQVKRLDSVMDQTVPIHGRGNFPTLHVKLKDLIILVKHKLQKEHSIEIRDVRLNGGCASYVLAPENSHYNDLDLIFGTDLSDENQFDVIRDVVLECLREFIPREQQQQQQGAEAGKIYDKEQQDNDNHHKNCQQQPENNKKQTTPQMPPPLNPSNNNNHHNHLHHPQGHQQLNNCSIKEAYVHKMVKVNDDDRWSLISLGAQQQSEGICGAGGNGQAVNCAQPSNKIPPLHEQQINVATTDGQGLPVHQGHHHHVAQHSHQHPNLHQYHHHHHHHHQFSVTLAYENENQNIMHSQNFQYQHNGAASSDIATRTDNIMIQPITYIHHEHLDQRNHHYHNQHNHMNYNHSNNHHNHHHHQEQPKQFPNSIELKFVDRMRRKFEFSVDSFQIILDSLLQFYDYAPQSTITMQKKKKKLISSSLSSASCSSSSSSSHDDGICDECSSSPIIDDNDDVGNDDGTKQKEILVNNNNRSGSSSTLYYDDDDDDDDDVDRDIDLFNNIGRSNYNYTYNNNASSCSVISENFYPTVIGRSEYGNFKEALFHLERRLIATRSPEEIRGGGLLKYCNLLVKNYKPKNVYQFRTLERYMCSRFFIDFSEINQQRAKLESYLANHFSDDPIQKFDYLTILHNVVQRSTVCLMNHELRLTLDMIRDLAYKLNEQHNQQQQHQSHHLRAQVVQPATTTTPANTNINKPINGNKQQ